MKACFLLLIAMSIVGCGAADRLTAGVTGGAAKTCIDGVTYLQFTSGATVQVDRFGKPVQCS